MNSSVYPTTTTTIADKRNVLEKQKWLDILLPILGLGLLVLLVITFSNNFRSLLTTCFHRCLCVVTSQDANTRHMRGNDNEDYQQDLPPSYSTTVVGRQASHISFRVVADDVSDVISMKPQVEADSIEKLPSYLEIMEEKRYKAEELSASLPSMLDSINKNATSTSSVIAWSSDSPTESDEEDDSSSRNELPPPYQTSSNEN